MLDRVRSYCLFIGVTALLSTSCSKFSKLSKSSNYDLKFEKAVEYYNKKDYYKAQTLLEDLRGVFRGTDKAEKVQYYTAYCSYGLGELTMAAYLLKNFARVYPASEHAEDAEFTAACCYYLVSPQTSLDQSTSKMAINDLQLFIDKYPNSEKRDSANKLVDILQVKLEKKAFDNAMLFYKILDYKAATTALKNVLKEYPDTRYREEIMFTILNSSFLLAQNSVAAKQYDRYKATINEYIAFVDKFPHSKKIKEAEKIYNSSLKFIDSKNGL